MKRFRSIFFFQILLLAVLLSCDTDFDTLKIIFCSPADSVTGVTAESPVEIAFSAGVNSTDVEDNFSVKNSEGAVNGRFQWISADRFRFTPDSPLAKNGRYVIELPRSIRDISGNTMDSDFISEFYVGSDFTAPYISSSTPPMTAGAETGIPVNRSIIINFSKSMNRESVEKEFSITPDVPGYFIWAESVPGLANSRLTYTLLGNMEYGKLYTFKVSASAEDSAGNQLAGEYRVNFITGDDFTPPEVQGIYDFAAPGARWNPAILNSGISRNVTIGITFTEGMERQSVERGFSVTPSVQGIFEWSSDSVVRFRPSDPLDPETRYQFAVETSAKDRNGLKLSSRYSVEILTDNADSRYITKGAVTGSNHDGDFTTLQGAWPAIIDMGGGTPANRSYFITIEFLSGINPAAMDKYSVFDNVIIDTFKGAAEGTTSLPDSAMIGDITWPAGGTVKIRIDGMTNKSTGQVPALYRLKIAGGESGIRDLRGNYLKEDLVIEFREAIP